MSPFLPCAPGVGLAVVMPTRCLRGPLRVLGVSEPLLGIRGRPFSGGGSDFAAHPIRPANPQLCDRFSGDARNISPWGAINFVNGVNKIKRCKGRGNVPSDSSHSALVIPSNSVRSKHGFPNTLMSAKYRAGHEGRNRKAIDARPPEGLPTAPEVNAWWSEARQWIKQVVKGLLDRTEIEADDVTQSVITKALAALPQFRGDSQFKTWLYRITIRTVADYRNGIRSDTASLDDVNLGQDDTMGPYFEPVAETVDFVCYIHASELLSKLVTSGLQHPRSEIRRRNRRGNCSTVTDESGRRSTKDQQELAAAIQNASAGGTKQTCQYRPEALAARGRAADAPARFAAKITSNPPQVIGPRGNYFLKSEDPAAGTSDTGSVRRGKGKAWIESGNPLQRCFFA